MKQVSKRLSWILTLVMILSLLTPLGSVLASDNNEVTITVLGTADLHGYINSWEYSSDSTQAATGMTKIQTLVKEEKAKNNNVILVDAGDTIQGNMMFGFNNNPVHPMVEAFNYMDYDTWTLGNHEFNFGQDLLNRNVAAFEGKVLAANLYKEDGTRYTNPYVIIEKSGVRVAIVGITNPNIPKWEAANAANTQGLKFTDPVEEAKKVVAELEGKYDVLIGTFHLGEGAEYTNTDSAKMVAEACPQFNAIIAAHAHAKFDNITSVSGVKIIEPGNNGWALAKIEVKVEKSGDKYAVKGVTTANLLTEKVTADKEMTDKFASMHDALRVSANEVIGKASARFIERADYITGADKITTMPTAMVQDNAVIDFIDEAQMYYTGAEVSSSAFFKPDANINSGDVKAKDMATIYMYDNTLVGVNITGKNLKAYMEWSANFYNTYKPGDLAPSFNESIRGYNYDMFDGVNYQIDISKPTGSRIVDATIKGAPIDDNKIYKLAVNNYRFGTQLLSMKLVTANDKFYDSEQVYGTDGGGMRALLGKYIKENLKGKLTPKVNNNWSIIGADFEHPLKAEIMEKVKAGKIKIPTSFDGRTLNVRALNVDDVAKLGEVKGTTVITLLTANDFHGTLAGDGKKNPGVSKFVGFLKNEEKRNINGTLILSAGDMYQGSADSNLLYGKPVVIAMNTAGFDAMTIGNHEFDWGIDKLKERITQSRFPYVAANIIEKATGKTPDFLKPYVIVNKNGINVGIIGIATPETATKAKPELVEPYDFKNPAEVVNALVPEVKKAGADVIVVLSHLGATQDSKTGEITGEAAELAKAVTGVDAIVTGHTHNTVSGTVNNIPIVQGYYNGRSVGVVDIFMNTDTKEVVKKNQYVDATVVKAIDDPNIANWFNYLQELIEPVKNEVLGKATADFPHSPNDTQTTLLGNWATDVMRKAVNADIAIQNGGGLRRDLPAGNVTMGVLYEIMPFDNTLYTMDLTGKQVKAAIEHGIMSTDFAPGQFSGLTVKYDSKKAAGERIVEIELADGTPLDENKLYKVVTNDFQASGGDKYIMFKEGKNGKDTSIPVRDVLVNEIKGKGTISPADDGRLMDVNKTSMVMFKIAA